ncbi:MAG: GH92 family glycosyl hydrolase [Prevotella sp.]|nr:GH92 family glycosyl hydrolase [Prevotella sp.]
MIRTFLITTLLSISVMVNDQTNKTSYVNPMIGTGGHGHVFLGANVPFGFVQLGPTEYTHGWDWCSGYHYSDSLMIGFGHLHLSGTGVGDLGDVALLPIADANQTVVRFSHENEIAKPGYYAIKLRNPNVLVELTATQRVGMHRYTFGGDVKRGMLRLDLEQGIGWDRVQKSQIAQENATTITGCRVSNGWAKRQQVFFVAEFSSPVKLTEQRKDTIGIIDVSDVSKPLLVKVALSSVSVENAKQNMRAELGGWDFAATVSAADAAWERELSKIEIETADDAVREIFYTAMYHSMTAPSVFNDVNGEYYGADLKTHQGDFTNYTTLSLWDTYRAAHPLQTLIHPEKQADIAKTFVNIYQQQGKLPVWHLMGNETDCMVGNPAIPVLADLVLKGYVTDKEGAYEAMRGSALLDERGLNLLKEYGYLPFDKHEGGETVAKGLEYALADACVAKVAKLLGKKKDYQYFLKRSQSYRIYFDPKTQFVRGVGSNGAFHEPFNPYQSDGEHKDYTEGNAWQYTWLVPHDVHGLVGLFPNEGQFITKLDSLFIVEGNLGENAPPDISGLIGQYAHGNEPSHHILYLYNYVGQPWKGAKLIRQTMSQLYSNQVDGLSGNEDVGQMSAWYILSAMGLYQVEPAGGKYIIGSPILDGAKVDVGDGKTFSIITKDNSSENIYVQSAKLNGKPYTKSYIMFNDIKKGGVLELQMGNQPSSWGTKKNDRP